MAIILPTGQWYAPSAGINDARYCMVLHNIAWYCMVLLGIAWNCMVLHGIAWYCMVLYCIAWYCIVLHGIAWYCIVLHGIALYCMVCMSHSCGPALGQADQFTRPNRWRSSNDGFWALVRFGQDNPKCIVLQQFQPSAGRHQLKTYTKSTKAKAEESESFKKKL